MDKLQKKKQGLGQGLKASSFGNPYSGPPNVVPFVKRADWNEDLDTFEEWLKQSKPWTSDKMHYMHLVAQVADDNEVPEKIRYRAALMLLRYSDSRDAVTRFFGPNLIEVMKGIGAAW